MAIFPRKRNIPGPEDLILFIHIPKTAGTSLRFGLERHFDKSNVIADYGPDSATTSRSVTENLYECTEPDRIERLINLLRSQGKAVLVGHFRLSKYSDFFPPEKVISIIRDPLVRAASEYLHVQRHDSFAGSFSDFFSDAQMINRLTRLLDNLDDRMTIGTTERNVETIKLINQKLGLRLRPARKNVAPKGGAEMFVKRLDQEVIDYFHHLNKEDFELYRAIDEKLAENKRSI